MLYSPPDFALNSHPSVYRPIFTCAMPGHVFSVISLTLSGVCKFWFCGRFVSLCLEPGGSGLHYFSMPMMSPAVLLPLVILTTQNEGIMELGPRIQFTFLFSWEEVEEEKNKFWAQRCQQETLKMIAAITLDDKDSVLLHQLQRVLPRLISAHRQ